MSARDDVVAYLERQFPGYDHWYTHADRILRIIEASDPPPCLNCDGLGCVACKMKRDHIDRETDECAVCHGKGHLGD